MIDEIVQVDVRDGTSIGVRIYRPDGAGPYPALLAASPYRYDNNACPPARSFFGARPGRSSSTSSRATPTSTWTCAAADVRRRVRVPRARTSRRTSTTSSSGSGGSRGRTARSAASASRISACCNGGWASSSRRRSPAAAHDGLNDPYRAAFYHGGIPAISSRLLVVPEPHHQPLSGERPAARAGNRPDALIAAHPTYDDFWRERCAWELLDDQGAALFGRRLGQDRSAHARQHRRLPARAGPKKLQMRAGRTPGRRTRSSTASSCTRRCCCRSTTITSRASRRSTRAAEGRVLRARRQPDAHRRDLAAAWRAIYALVPQRAVRQRHSLNDGGLSQPRRGARFNHLQLIPIPAG